MIQSNANQPGDEKENGQKNEPMKPIESGEEVQESNDEKIDQDFPGYPHYPAKEDVLDPDNEEGRVDMDVDNLTSHPVTNAENAVVNVAAGNENKNDINQSPASDADVTEEDLMMLGDKNQDMDMGDDEAFDRSSTRLDSIGADLDVPGAEMDDENEMLGEEDEENNYYSIGGDNHENLEEPIN